MATGTTRKEKGTRAEAVLHVKVRQIAGIWPI
jgi:hypothetical protein